MKSVFTVLLMFAAIWAANPTPTYAASAHEHESILSCPPEIPPRILIRLFLIAADEFDMPLRQVMLHYFYGNLTITPVIHNGDTAYMIAYDGWCILAVLEDRL